MKTLNGYLIGAILCALIACVTIISAGIDGSSTFQENALWYGGLFAIPMIIFIVKGTSGKSKSNDSDISKGANLPDNFDDSKNN